MTAPVQQGMTSSSSQSQGTEEEKTMALYHDLLLDVESQMGDLKLRLNEERQVYGSLLEKERVALREQTDKRVMLESEVCAFREKNLSLASENTCLQKERMAQMDKQTRLESEIRALREKKLESGFRKYPFAKRQKREAQERKPFLERSPEISVLRI